MFIRILNTGSHRFFKIRVIFFISMDDTLKALLPEKLCCDPAALKPSSACSFYSCYPSGLYYHYSGWRSLELVNYCCETRTSIMIIITTINNNNIL